MIMARKTFHVISWGGLGDVLLSTPTLYSLKKQDPTCRIVVYCVVKRHQEVYQHNPDVDRITDISFIKNPWPFICYYLKWTKFYHFSYGQLFPSLFYKKKAARLIAEEIFGTTLEDDKIRVYLTEKEEKWAREQLAPYKNPVIIHISSIASKNQEWPVDYWNKLISEMPEYTFIQLGVATENQVDKAIDFRGRTTFREAMAIIKNAKSFVGVVSSFSHATNAFDTPGVVLFGASAVEVWGHPNNINLFKGLSCAPCIDRLEKSPCPYDKQCMTGISVEEVKHALLKQLNKSMHYHGESVLQD